MGEGSGGSMLAVRDAVKSKFEGRRRRGLEEGIVTLGGTIGAGFRLEASVALVRSSRTWLPPAAARISIASSSLEPAQSSDFS